MKLLFKILFAFFVMLTFPLIGKDQYVIDPSIRFTLPREENHSPIIYYFSHPQEKNYPILVLCDGSSSKRDLRSVLFIRNYFEKRIKDLQVGYLTIEKWGTDGNQTNEKEFFEHYTCSQRLKDHLSVISHLEKNPPLGWNGKFIFMGVSEGGPLVTDLTTLCPNTLATINWVGATDCSWADELWTFFEHWKEKSFLVRLYDAVPRWIPFSIDIPKTREELDDLIPKIIANPSPDLFMGGMTYLYHADAFQKPPLDYTKIRFPFLVVAGAEDSSAPFTDRFVQKAKEAHVPITYFRIEGMDHYIRKRSDVIDRSFDWLQHLLQENSTKIFN